MAHMSANARPADTLYHYTTADGLLGIIDKPKFNTTITANPAKVFARALSLRASDVRSSTTAPSSDTAPTSSHDTSTPRFQALLTPDSQPC
ncbi:hypothetical protein BFL43_09170 [Williamsia sp. 1135]|nr:hypothetical protein BFL43_09170 [Williamsia sp. 1135]